MAETQSGRSKQLEAGSVRPGTPAFLLSWETLSCDCFTILFVKIYSAALLPSWLLLASAALCLLGFAVMILREMFPPLYEIAAFMGHADPKTTTTYAHLVPKDRHLDVF